MRAERVPVESATVGNEEKGRAIRDRRVGLALTVKDLAARASIGRDTLAKLEAGDPNVRPVTVGAVERALDEVEAFWKREGVTVEEASGDRIVEFRVSGNFGVDVVLKGPVDDLPAMEAAVNRLVARMQQEADPD
jgi:predicted transcriptional regulator